VTPRSEPLLWLQLIGLGVFPLEALLLLLLLAGSDPGPMPGLERLLCWSIGALAPALLLARRPADVWSLLLLQTPLRARRDLQRRLSSLQSASGLKLPLAAGAALCLPLLWWIDRHAAVATAFTPLASGPRLVALLLAALLLAVMLWQWQQLLQALWLLTRTPQMVAATRPLTQAELEEQCLCLGLPLLLLEPLRWPPPPSGPPRNHDRSASVPADAPGMAVATDVPSQEPASSIEPMAVEPEQPPEKAEGSDLDQQIP
jgi:hypothetical protein